MLQITIPASSDLWDERKQEFVYTKERTLQLEHSLVSISKWESKWHKPFLGKTEKSVEEILDYIKCMTLTRNVEPEVYYQLIENQTVMNEIYDYINDPMTATTFSGGNDKRGRQGILTSEVIYYLMFSYGIPKDCEKWHIARLIVLIRVFGEKNDPSKKMSRSEIMKRNAAINAANRKRFNSKG